MPPDEIVCELCRQLLGGGHSQSVTTEADESDRDECKSQPPWNGWEFAASTIQRPDRLKTEKVEEPVFVNVERTPPVELTPEVFRVATVGNLEEHLFDPLDGRHR